MLYVTINLTNNQLHSYTAKQLHNSTIPQLHPNSDTHMSHKKQLLNKISSHTARIGIIGLGYVGLPLGLTFTRKGFTVIGFDVHVIGMK